MSSEINNDINKCPFHGEGIPQKHNSGKGAKSTRGFKWKIIYKKKFYDKRSAMSFEYKLKKNKKERQKILFKNKI